MVSSEELDAKYEIDAILDFNTRIYDGRRVVRIVQVKTHEKAKVEIVKIDPEKLQYTYFGGIFDQKDALRMIRGATENYLKKNINTFIIY